MTFYQLFDFEKQRMVNINPKNISMYEYISQYSTLHSKNIEYVKIYTFNNQYIKVLRDSFEQMLILGGIDEY